MEDLQEKLNALDKNIGDIIVLVVPERIEAASNLVTKYTKEFYEKIKNEEEAEKIEKAFNPFVNNIMSIVEVLMNNKASNFRSTRKLILNYLYDFKKELIGGDNKIDA